MNDPEPIFYSVIEEPSGMMFPGTDVELIFTIPRVWYEPIEDEL